MCHFNEPCGLCSEPCVRITVPHRFHTVHRCGAHKQDEAHLEELKRLFGVRPEPGWTP